MSKLIDIAKECGASETSTTFIKELLVMKPNKLRATVEQVCAPLVYVLELVENDITDYMKHRDANKLLFAIGVQLVRIQATLPVYRTIMGDKK